MRVVSVDKCWSDEVGPGRTGHVILHPISAGACSSTWYGNSLVACALQAFAALFQLVALFVAGGGTSLSAFTGQRVQNLALLLLNMNAQAFNIYLAFFGFWLISIGYLILWSTFFPRIIGVLLALDVVGWVTYLWPPLASSIYPVIAVIAALGELPFLLWLLVVGVNEQRWKEQARLARESLRT